VDKAKLQMLACMVLAAVALSACDVDERYYVKTDGSPDVLHGVAHPAAAVPVPLDLGVTFKSDGKVSPGAADVLYQSVSDGLSAGAQWQVHRLGGSGDDFAPAIAAIVREPAGSAVPGRTRATQRMLMLVENAPDLSEGTKASYLFSGMTFGVHGVHKPTDRYAVTIAYRDGSGIDHIYRSHQELLFATGNKLLGSDDRALAGLRQYDTALAAFKGIVDNSVNGAQKAIITVGQPRPSQPGKSAQADKPAP